MPWDFFWTLVFQVLIFAALLLLVSPVIYLAIRAVVVAVLKRPTNDYVVYRGENNG